MIIDTSALMAIALDEADKDLFTQAIVDASDVRMSVANWLEAALVVQGLKMPALTAYFDGLGQLFDIEMVSVDLHQAELARVGGLRFGKGHHQARLNYGDCFAYALARVTGETLLFKGNDFAQTDIEPALPR